MSESCKFCLLMYDLLKDPSVARADIEEIWGEHLQKEHGIAQLAA